MAYKALNVPYVYPFDKSRAKGRNGHFRCGRLGLPRQRRHGPPVWSPDGRFLITRRFPLRGPDVVPFLWLIDLESGALRHLLEPGDFPAFAP